MNIKSLIIVIAILLLGGGAWYYFHRTDTGKIQWRTANAEQGDVKVVVTATGTLNPDTTVAVGTQVSGIIAKVLTDFNKRVRKGQLLAVLDTTPLWQNVEDARAALAKAKANKDLTKANLDRERSLFAQKLSPQSDLDASVAAYESAAADVLSAQAQLDKAKTNLNYAYIHSPIEGVVVSRNVDVGQTVAASFNTPTLFSIANTLTRMQVWASIDESDIGMVENGQNVDFTVDAYPNRTFHGTVSQIRLQPVTSANVVDYTAIIAVQNPDLKLLPGMTANLTVNVQQHEGVVKVPTAALHFSPPADYMQKLLRTLPDSVKERIQEQRAKRGGAAGGSTFGVGGETQGGALSLFPGTFAHIWVKEGDSIKPVRVRVGLSDGSFTEVSGGVQPGQEVVLGIIAGTAAAVQRSPFNNQRHF